MSVERDASVIVRAPEGMAEEKIHRLIEAKRFWLYQKINHGQKYPLRQVRKEFVSGETILYLGRNYRLQVTEKDVPGIVFQSRFEISRKNQPRAAELFKLWYLQQAEERIPQRAKYFAEALTQSAKTPTWKFCSPALKVLIQNGGTATLNEILTGLEVSLSQTLTDSDRKIMDSRGFPRWHQAVQRAYRQCQREGWIEKQKRRDGTWRITSKGRAVAEETEAAPAPR